MSQPARPLTTHFERRTLSFELTLAVMIKLVLLTGLWFLFFNNPDTNSDLRDLNALFPATANTAPKEPGHAR